MDDIFDDLDGEESEDEEKDEEGEEHSQNYVPWQTVYDMVQKDELISCKLKTDIEEHIVASLLYWQKVTGFKWYCVQVIRAETISEEKRCLVLEIKNDHRSYAVKYFVAHELGSVYFVEDFELTRKSKTKLAKVRLIGAKISTK